MHQETKTPTLSLSWHTALVKVFYGRDVVVPPEGLTKKGSEQYVKGFGSSTSFQLDLYTVNPGVTIPEANGTLPMIPASSCTKIQSKLLSFDLPQGEHEIELTYRNDGRMSQFIAHPVGQNCEPQSWFMHDGDDDLSVASPALYITNIADQSGSMGGNKLEQIKLSIEAQLPAWIEANARVGLITFGQVAKRALDFTTDAVAISDAVQALTVTGSTPMAEAIAEAIELIKEHPDKRHIVLLWSDGAPNNLTDAIVRAEAMRQIADTVVAIGIGENANQDLLQQFVASSPKDYFFGEAPDLRSVFQTITHLYIKPTLEIDNEVLF